MSNQPQPTDGSFALSMGNTVEVPANWGARIVALIAPNSWPKLVPASWVGHLTIHARTEPLPATATAEQVQRALQQIGVACFVTPGEPAGTLTVTFGGEAEL